MQRGGQRFLKYPHVKIDYSSNETNNIFDHTQLNSFKSDNIIQRADSSLQSSEKNKLVQELEKNLAVIDNHSVDLSRLEEEKTAVVMERNSLLREMEETILEIQSHVVNAKELELEKKVIEEECNDLREQVEHLRRVLESSSNGLQGDRASLGALYEEEQLRNQALEEELSKLRSQNEGIMDKGHHSDPEEISVTAMERELELLHDENCNLQKQLQMAEESEDNLAVELTQSNAKITELQAENEALSKESRKLKSTKEQLELECDDLTCVLEQLRVANSKLQDASDASIAGKVSEKDKSKLQEAKGELEKTKDKVDQLEQKNREQEQKIKSLEQEIKSLGEHQSKAPQGNGSVGQKGSGPAKQLKAALDKLNKENSQLHETVEKNEKEISSLKELLEKEKAGKGTLKETTVSQNVEGSSKDGEKTSEGALPEEVRAEIELLKKQRQQLRSECDALSETIAYTAKEKRKLEERIASLNEEISKLKSTVEELQAKIKDLEKVKVEKEALEQTLANQKKQYGDLTKKYENTNQKYYEKSSELERAQLDRDHMDKKYKDLHKSVEKIKKDLSDAQHEMLTRADEVKFLKQKHNEERNVLSSSLDKDRQVHKEVKDELRSVSEKLNATEAERHAIENAYKSKQSTVNDLKETIKNLEREVVDLREQLSESSEARLEEVGNLERQKSESDRDKMEEVAELKRKLSESNKAKLEAEDRAAMSDKATNDLQKAQAVSSDMAMEKSLELSRVKRILEKKIERLTRENLELKKKLESSGRTSSAGSSPITVQTQQVPVESLDVDRRLAALEPPANRERHGSEQSEENGIGETVAPPMDHNYKPHNGEGDGQMRRPTDDRSAPNYARFPARGQRHTAQENGLGEHDRFADDVFVQPAVVNHTRMAPRSGDSRADRRNPGEPGTSYQKRGSLTSAGNRGDTLIEGFGHAAFSANKVKVTAASKPQPSAPKSYRISQSEAAERPPPPADPRHYNSHGYERARPERVAEAQPRHDSQAHYAYQILRERSTVERNAPPASRADHQPRHAQNTDRYRPPPLDPPDNQNSGFQVVGYRKGKQFIYEDYV